MGCSLSNFIRVILVGSFFDLILSFRASLPRRRCLGCIGSIVAFLCGMVCLVTCLTGWINSFWLSFGSVTVFVVVIMIGDVAVWVRGIGVTVFVSSNILNIFSLCSLFFQQSTLISVMSWFSQWWYAALGLSAFAFAVLWLKVFICSSSGVFKPFSSTSFSRCVRICSYVPFSKIFWFLQVWWQFGVCELFNVDVGGNSESVFGQFLEFVKKLYQLMICCVEDKFLEFEVLKKFSHILSGRAIDVFKCL